VQLSQAISDRAIGLGGRAGGRTRRPRPGHSVSFAVPSFSNNNNSAGECIVNTFENPGTKGYGKIT
jgi:hypothetical protein